MNWPQLCAKVAVGFVSRMSSDRTQGALHVSTGQPGKEEDLSAGSCLYPVFHGPGPPLWQEPPHLCVAVRGSSSLHGLTGAQTCSPRSSCQSAPQAGLPDLTVVAVSAGTPAPTPWGQRGMVDRASLPGSKASSHSPGVGWRQRSQRGCPDLGGTQMASRPVVWMLLVRSSLRPAEDGPLYDCLFMGWSM